MHVEGSQTVLLEARLQRPSTSTHFLPIADRDVALRPATSDAIVLHHTMARSSLDDAPGVADSLPPQPAARPSTSNAIVPYRRAMSSVSSLDSEPSLPPKPSASLFTFGGGSSWFSQPIGGEPDLSRLAAMKLELKKSRKIVTNFSPSSSDSDGDSQATAEVATPKVNLQSLFGDEAAQVNSW